MSSSGSRKGGHGEGAGGGQGHGSRLPDAPVEDQGQFQEEENQTEESCAEGGQVAEADVARLPGRDPQVHAGIRQRKGAPRQG